MIQIVVYTYTNCSIKSEQTITKTWIWKGVEIDHCYKRKQGAVASYSEMT